MKYRPIRLEPREDFDKAIVHQYKNGTLVYSYEMLIAVVMEQGVESEQEAIEHVEFNIMNLKSPQFHFVVRD
jgi:hypothetical protein